MNEYAIKAKNAMLAIQRYPWEQGVCAQALLEAGDIAGGIAMAHDAVLRQTPDGRLAVINQNIAVTDPAANGEPVLRAYEITKDPFYLEAAQRMLAYLKNDAPRTSDGVLYHNEISFQEGFSKDQLWVDSFYMAPPFLAAMGELDDAFLQINGLHRYLIDETTGLLYHNFDVGTNRFVRKLLWATGNGWALMGIARVRALAENAGRRDMAQALETMGISLLESMLPFTRPDGLYHDILNDETSFVDGSSAMMRSVFVFRGIFEGWLDKKYQPIAEKTYQTMLTKFDLLGLLHDVCGCPHFVSPGTSAEAQASFIMMQAWREKLGKA